MHIDSGKANIKENEVTLRRLFAIGYDFIFYFITPVVIMIGVGPLLGAEHNNQSFYFIYIGVLLCLFLLKDFITGRSIGKMLFSLKITQNNDLPIKRIKLLLRNITYILGFIEIILVMIGNERMGDIFTKTYVISNTENFKAKRAYVIFFATVLLMFASIAAIAIIFGTVSYVP